MKSVQLPGGGKAWFVKTRKGRHCGLKPVSAEGRLLTGAYGGFVGAVSWVFADADFRPVLLAVWIALVAAATFLYILTALRMSAPASGPGKGAC